MNEQTQRIISIMQEKNMNPTQFSEAIGIQRAAMSHITIGRNNPSADVITKIIERFEDINPKWLLTGKGAMKDMDKTSSTEAIQKDLPNLFENSAAERVNKAKNDSKTIEKEVIKYVEREVKSIEKILVFFSDQTYKTFIPEK